MRIKENLLLALLLISSTVLFAQTSDSTKVKCYTVKELEAISNKLIDGAECDTLLKIANREIDAYTEVIDRYEELVLTQSQELETQKAISGEYKHGFDEITLILNDEIKAHNKTKFLWGGSVAGIILIGILFAVN